MGDVIHALPGVASLKHGFARSHVTWVIRPRWMPLLEGNPFVDEVIPYERNVTGIRAAWNALRARRFDLAVDFQGLVQSALIAAAARADRVDRLSSIASGGAMGVAVLFERGDHAFGARGGTESGTGDGGWRVQYSARVSDSRRISGRQSARWEIRARQPACRLGREAVAARLLSGAGREA